MIFVFSQILIVVFSPGHLVDNSSKEESKKETRHHINFSLTIEDVLERIKNGFPDSLSDIETSDFLTKSRTFVDSLVSLPDKLQHILKTLPDKCSYCDLHPLHDWIHKPAKSYFFSIGHLREINIQVKVCSKCRRAFYPDFYQNGLIFLHNKFVITIEAILDLGNVLQTGGSFIEVIKKKLLLLGQLEGLNMEALRRDIGNTALKLEKSTIAVLALLLKGSDMDDVICYICGIAPKIVCTDGNVKVTLHRTYLICCFNYFKLVGRQ